MFKEYEVIRSTRKLSDKVPKGCIGTILIVHKSLPVAYEIEFVDVERNTLEILTVLENDIEKKQ